MNESTTDDRICCHLNSDVSVETFITTFMKFFPKLLFLLYKNNSLKYIYYIFNHNYNIYTYNLT